MHSRIELVGDGTTVRFPITFTLGYLRQTYVSCRVGNEVDASGNAVYRNITWDINDPNWVTISGNAPESGVPVVFTREVPVDSLLYNFQQGAHLSSVALNESHEQLMMAIHQMVDAFVLLTRDMNISLEGIRAEFIAVTNQIREEFNTVTAQLNKDFSDALLALQSELVGVIDRAYEIARESAGEAVTARFATLKVVAVIIPDDQEMGASYDPDAHTITLRLHETALPGMTATIRGGARLGTGLSITDADKLNIDFASDQQLQVGNSSQPPTAGQLASLYTRTATLEGNRVLRTGDTMTGSLVLKGANTINQASISATGSVNAGTEVYIYKPNLAEDSHYANISFRTTNKNGTTSNKFVHLQSISEDETQGDNAFIISGRGMLLAGSGESATAMRSVLVTGDTVLPIGLSRYWIAAGSHYDSSEQTILTSDNNIHFITACNDIANARGMYLTTAGNLSPHMGEGQLLGGTAARWDAYIRDLNVSGITTAPFNQILHIQDQKPSGTAGGTFTSGAWRVRDLNTVLHNSIPGASLNTSTNRFTLPTGTYLVEISAPAYNVQSHQAKLVDYTTDISVLLGTSARSMNNNVTLSIIFGILSVSTPTIYSVQHQCALTLATDGLGYGFGVINMPSVFTNVLIKRIN